MTMLPKRRPGSRPVNAPAVDVAALHAYLKAHPTGLTWTNLALRFQHSASVAAVALAGALDRGLVRVDYSGEYILYYAAEHLDLPAALDAAVDVVVAFISAHEDDERGCPDVTLALDRVISGLAPRFSVQQVFAAVEVLCQESLLWFHALAGGVNSGLLTVTLSRHQYVTVVAYDTDAHQPLCFNVRAGNKEVAVRKVHASAYGGLELKLMGVTQGDIEFSSVEGYGGMLVVRL